jgi:hypothetical protein
MASKGSIIRQMHSEILTIRGESDDQIIREIAQSIEMLAQRLMELCEMTPEEYEQESLPEEA